MFAALTILFYVLVFFVPLIGITAILESTVWRDKIEQGRSWYD